MLKGFTRSGRFCYVKSNETPGTTTQIIYIFIGWSSPGLLYKYNCVSW